MLGALRNLGRLQEITTVLIRHGFGEIAGRLGLGRGAAPADAEGEAERRRMPTAARLRLVLQDLGPTFIKLGQILSTREDLLPPDLIVELKKLQEEVAPIPFSEIRKVIEDCLGAPLAELYVRFDEEPLAAASIGQVHRATLGTPEGPREVVVKVQRPGVADKVVRDLDLLRRLAALVEGAIPESRIYSPTGLVAHFDRSISAELDFGIEADNAERFAQDFAGTPGVCFPRIYREVSARRVLTMEFLDGRKLPAALAAGQDGKLLSRQAIAVVLKMIFEHGFFHADPHPGNVLILGEPAAPVLGFIDLGMVGRLSPELRDKTIDLMVAAARKDTVGVADALYAIGRPSGKVDMAAYRAEVAELAEKYLGKSLKDIELSAMIRDLVQGGLKYSIAIPPDFMLLGKTMMTLEGIGKQLDPELDVFAEAAPHFLGLLRRRYSPQRLGEDLLRGLGQLSRAGYGLPLQVREILDDLRGGHLLLQSADPGLPAAADRLGRRLFSGLIGAALLGGGALLLALGRSEAVGYVLLALAALWILAHLARDWRRRG